MQTNPSTSSSDIALFTLIRSVLRAFLFLAHITICVLLLVTFIHGTSDAYSILPLTFNIGALIVLIISTTILSLDRNSKPDRLSIPLMFAGVWGFALVATVSQTIRTITIGPARMCDAFAHFPNRCAFNTAVMVLSWSTNIAACFGCITSLLIELRFERSGPTDDEKDDPTTLSSKQFISSTILHTESDGSPMTLRQALKVTSPPVKRTRKGPPPPIQTRFEDMQFNVALH